MILHNDNIDGYLANVTYSTLTIHVYIRANLYKILTRILSNLEK